MASTMKAWMYNEAGAPAECLHIEEHYPQPVPKENEVLIRVYCSALNPMGWKSISKSLTSSVMKKPGVPEFDFSGTVAGGNLEGTGLTVGQEVFGSTPAQSVMFSGHGALAEYTVAPAQCVVPKPANLSHAEAASFPLAGLTAWAALVNNGQLKTRVSKRVFVNGGSGGVGVYAIQIAKAFGAYVVSTSSPESDALLKSIGADETIDYRDASPLSAHLSTHYRALDRMFDLILDTVGALPALYTSCDDYLVPDGVYLDIAGAGHHDKRFLNAAVEVRRDMPSSLRTRMRYRHRAERDYKTIVCQASRMSEELTEAAALLASGQIKPVLDGVYPFGEALKAYERQMSGRSKGKVVVSVS